MQLKCNCLVFNFTNLVKSIYNYVEINKEDPLYLVMNEDTKIVLKEQKDNIDIVKWTKKECKGHILTRKENEEKYCSFLKIPIAICNKLEYGEVIIL